MTDKEITKIVESGQAQTLAVLVKTSERLIDSNKTILKAIVDLIDSQTSLIRALTAPRRVA